MKTSLTSQQHHDAEEKIGNLTAMFAKMTDANSVPNEYRHCTAWLYNMPSTYNKEQLQEIKSTSRWRKMCATAETSLGTEAAKLFTGLN